MAEFTVNPTRVDPYKNFKFRVKWDNKPIPGVCKVSALHRTTDVVVHREGATTSLGHRSPGLTAYVPIVISRGRTHDTSFEDWANSVWLRNGSPEVALKDFRKNITIEFLNEAAIPVMAFSVYRCWPSEYVALSDLDANAEHIALETLVLQHEGWDRDAGVKETKEPG